MVYFLLLYHLGLLGPEFVHLIGYFRFELLEVLFKGLVEFLTLLLYGLVLLQIEAGQID